MQLTSIRPGHLVEIEPRPGELRIVGAKHGRTIDTYALNDGLYKGECITVTGFKVVAHYAKLKSKTATSLASPNVVSINKGGRIFHAVLVGPDDGDFWVIRPITRGITYFRVTRREITAIFQERAAAPWVVALAE